jgi:hypothetical protein
MKTGANQDVKNFIELNTLEHQQFVCEADYYNLSNYDLNNYTRKIAIVDVRHDNLKFRNSNTFNDDFIKRCGLLHSQGFKFIQNTAWESLENIKNTELYPVLKLEHLIWAGNISWFWAYMYNKHHNSNLNFIHTEKKYDFLYLNKQKRDHRKKLFDMLLQKDVLTNSLYTNWPQRKLPKEYELPWVHDYPAWGMDQEIYEKPYNDTYCSIVSETNDNSNEIFMTEKIWKPILAQQIFVVHGNYLYLQKLKEIGFKTFGAFFDESYDLEKDSSLRIKKIADLCVNLKLANWSDLYLRTIKLRDHNLKTFLNKFKLAEQVNKTLNLFLEFADRS